MKREKLKMKNQRENADMSNEKKVKAFSPKA